METKHTKEPWDFYPTSGNMKNNYSQGFGIIERGSRNLIAGLFSDVRGGDEVAIKNAARIVACVNAMKDVSDPAEFMEQVQQSFNATMDLKFQRNELLEALENIAKMQPITQANTIDCFYLARNSAHAAIKKAKGEL